MKVEQQAGLSSRRDSWYCRGRKVLLGEGQGEDAVSWDAGIEHLNLRCHQKKTIKGDCVRT